MKENIIEVLLYLFEYYIDTSAELEADQAEGSEQQTEIIDKSSLELELEQAGFRPQEISKALDWLENITIVPEETQAQAALPALSMRVYSEQEQARLNAECRGYLLFLEQAGLLDDVTREVVIERTLALETEDIDLEQLKSVVLMVMFYQPGQEVAYAWVEELVFDDLVADIH